MSDHDHLSGGSYRQNADGSLTLLERTGAQPCPCETPTDAPADEPAAPVTPLASRRRRDAAPVTQTTE